MTTTTEMSVDWEERYMELEARVQVLEESKKVVKKEKVLKSNNSKIVLPFLGKCIDGKCRGIRPTHELYGQCMTEVLEGVEYCKVCAKSAEENGGKPKYGTIDDRLSHTGGVSEKYLGEHKIKPYGNIVKCLKLEKEKCIAEALKYGVELVEEDFKEIGRGRKKKETTAAVSDTESEGVVEPKKRGRPKKAVDAGDIVPVVGDLLDALVQTADEKKPTLEELDKMSNEDMKKIMKREKLKVGKKAENKEILQKHYNLVEEDGVEEHKKTAPVNEAVDKPEDKAEEKAEEKELEKEEVEEEDDEDSTEVSKFTIPGGYEEGKECLKSDKPIEEGGSRYYLIYDANDTDGEMGDVFAVWDENTEEAEEYDGEE
tara:strand:- start:320 stop:1432 length:1113 start_codon:yes stop_codon:yes gene_type:complete